MQTPYETFKESFYNWIVSIPQSLCFRVDIPKVRVYQLTSRKPKKQRLRWTVARGRVVFYRCPSWEMAIIVANALAKEQRA